MLAGLTLLLPPIREVLAITMQAMFVFPASIFLAGLLAQPPRGFGLPRVHLEPRQPVETAANPQI